MAESYFGIILRLIVLFAPVIALSVISFRMGRRRLALLPVTITVIFGLASGYFVGWYDGEPTVDHAVSAFRNAFAQAALIAICITSVTLAVVGQRPSNVLASLGEPV